MISLERNFMNFSKSTSKSKDERVIFIIRGIQHKLPVYCIFGINFSRLANIRAKNLIDEFAQINRAFKTNILYFTLSIIGKYNLQLNQNNNRVVYIFYNNNLIFSESFYYRLSYKQFIRNVVPDITSCFCLNTYFIFFLILSDIRKE